MVDDFIVCIDRLIASTACFGSAEEDGRECDGVIHVEPVSVSDSGGGEGCSSSSSSNTDDVVVECRICQEEDQVQAMEAPCSCNGTLKVLPFLGFLFFFFFCVEVTLFLLSK